jgi:N-acetylglucosamine kinase-like BadF-type ATPase
MTAVLKEVGKDNPMFDKYYAGWDGGGTHTTVECINENGATLLRAKVGPFNSLGNEPETLNRAVADSLGHMKSMPGGLAGCGGLCIGGAGISSVELRENLRSALVSNGYTQPYTLAADYETAYFSAFHYSPGMVLVSGTGSVCYGRNTRQQSHRTGGWGHLIDDEGSGYAIGRDMLSAVMYSLDGRGGPTVLTEMVYKAWGISSHPELITRLYASATGKKDIAALAPLCFKAAENGDETAMDIIKKAAVGLYTLIHTTARILGLNQATVVLLGGTITNGALLRTELQKLAALSTFNLVSTIGINAANGAARMALKVSRG